MPCPDCNDTQIIEAPATRIDFGRRPDGRAYQVYPVANVITRWPCLTCVPDAMEAFHVVRR